MWQKLLHFALELHFVSVITFCGVTPLVPIFQKPLHAAPKRLQRMLLRLQKYNLHVQYLPGSKMLIADTLSRAYPPGDHDSKEDMPEYQIFQLTREN